MGFPGKYGNYGVWEFLGYFYFLGRDLTLKCVGNPLASLCLKSGTQLYLTVKFELANFWARLARHLKRYSWLKLY